MFSRKPKITVEIVGEAGIKSKKKYPIEANTVVIRPARKGPGGAAYKAKFSRDCLLPYWKGLWPFKRLTYKLMLKDGADSCIGFYPELDETDVPMWDVETERKLFEAHVIKAAGATVQKIQVPTLLYIVLFLIFVIGIINLLMSSGKVRFV